MEADGFAPAVWVHIVRCGSRLAQRNGVVVVWLVLVARVEFPFPALIAADLHVVVCRVLCPVTCAPCWAALCTGESNPRAARRAPERWPDFPPAAGCARLRDDYLLHPGRMSIHEIELPVGLLDADVKLADLPGQVISLRPQLRYRQGGEHLEL